jgi:hypothetical protein
VHIWTYSSALVDVQYTLNSIIKYTKKIVAERHDLSEPVVVVMTDTMISLGVVAMWIEEA